MSIFLILFLLEGEIEKTANSLSLYGGTSSKQLFWDTLSLYKNDGACDSKISIPLVLLCLTNKVDD